MNKGKVFILFGRWDNSNYVLGCYSSIEKANEVLNDVKKCEKEYHEYCLKSNVYISCSGHWYKNWISKHPFPNDINASEYFVEEKELLS